MLSIEQINANPEIMRHYTPGHQLTLNYIEGMQELAEGRLHDALPLLESESADSPCYGLARGNSGLVLLHLGQYQQSEQRSSEAIDHFDKYGCPHPPSCAQFARNLGESVSRQGRQHEAIRFLNKAVGYARKLMEIFPDFAEDLEIESGHAFNSWGGTLLEIGNLHASIDCLRAALDIYRKYAHRNRVGMAETLTNYGLVLTELGRFNDAWMALQEALPIARHANDQNQIRRIQIAIIRLDPLLLTDGDPYVILEEAAAEAQNQGRFSTAYIRRCIKATLAVDRGDVAVGNQAVAAAIRIESNLDSSDPSPARLRLPMAQLRDAAGASIDEVLNILITGAHLWFERLRKPSIGEDFRAASYTMHEHFRFLSRKLIETGRLDEALTAFEAGRALGYSIEVDPSIMGRIVNSNHLGERADAVDCTHLRSIQSELKDQEAILVIAFLPPDLVAFIVKSESIQTVSLPLPDDSTANQSLLNEIRLIPGKLHKDVGESALPQFIHDFGAKLRGEIGGLMIKAILPNSILHNVPWRALFHHLGIPWDQLPCTTGFGLLLHDRQTRVIKRACTALGNGSAGAVDLNTEARVFAEAFGADGHFVLDCNSRDIEAAICREHIVLVSCHGELKEDWNTGQKTLFLEVKDGSKAANDIFPDQIKSDVVVLSACNSGVYEVTWSDYPVGAAPDLIKAGARYCVCARFPVGAAYAAAFMKQFGEQLAGGAELASAFIYSLKEMETQGFELWKDLACLEVVGRAF